jgi:hypothetical protein
MRHTERSGVKIYPTKNYKSNNKSSPQIPISIVLGSQNTQNKHETKTPKTPIKPYDPQTLNRNTTKV